MLSLKNILHMWGVATKFSGFPEWNLYTYRSLRGVTFEVLPWAAMNLV
jgi:hypothetical protein